MESYLDLLDQINADLGIATKAAKKPAPAPLKRTPLIFGDAPPPSKRKPAKKTSPPKKGKKPIHRTPIVTRGGKIDRQAQARLTRKPNSKINPKSSITPREWLSRNVWVGVVSSNVKKIRYDAKRYELHVGFLNGSEYKYTGIDRLFARQMFDSASKGRFVWRRLRRKGRPYQRLK